MIQRTQEGTREPQACLGGRTAQMKGGEGGKQGKERWMNAVKSRRGDSLITEDSELKSKNQPKRKYMTRDIGMLNEVRLLELRANSIH